MSEHIIDVEDQRLHYPGLEIGRLTSQEEHYILHMTRGINPVAAARAAGYSRPKLAVAELAQRNDIRNAIAYFREMARQTAVQAGAIEFTKNDATLLYLEAHSKATTATEEIKAVDSLVKLHGLASPEKTEIQITRADQLEGLDDAELARIAGQDIELSPDDYFVKE